MLQCIEGAKTMGFRKRLFNRVESDSGFIVKIRVFSGYVEYREGHRVAKIPVEPVMGETVVNVYANTSIKWEHPYVSDLISEEKRKEILTNVVDALRFRKVPVDFV